MKSPFPGMHPYLEMRWRDVHSRLMVYLICVRRASFPHHAESYPAPLREPLPNIPIPLRPSDTDVILQLQPLIDECYHRGRHGKPTTPKSQLGV